METFDAQASGKETLNLQDTQKLSKWLTYN